MYVCIHYTITWILYFSTVWSRRFYLKLLAHKMFSIPLSIFSLLYFEGMNIFIRSFIANGSFIVMFDKVMKKTNSRLFVYYRTFVKAHMLSFKYWSYWPKATLPNYAMLLDKKFANKTQCCVKFVFNYTYILLNGQTFIVLSKLKHFLYR